MLTVMGLVVERAFPGYVWVEAEIASLTDRRHLYLDLVELGEDGKEMARARANLWARERYRIAAKFRAVTGGELAPGMRVLVKAVPEFHPQYGFSLNILDISAGYTAGAAQEKLARIRRTLEQEGLYDRNRNLEGPADFARVAVISPRSAAGLGDFREEADRLEAAGLCRFSYFEALFQGREAAASLKEALEDVTFQHALEAFDAVVLIRGGGAASDLAWLNDLELARTAARLPLPLLTGIGHARDDTILDEIAHTRFDTPSKVVQHLENTISENGRRALAAYESIRRLSRELLARRSTGLDALYTRIRRAAAHRVEVRSRDLDALMRRILGLSPQATLARGYALVRARGRTVRSAAEARQHAALELVFEDGTLEVTHEP
nr:exodeoxyribonuclease VII large subunit [Deinobacterium chartae]